MDDRVIESDYYAIEPRPDGLVDVYLIPSGVMYPVKNGMEEYDADVRVVYGVTPWDGIESDIRAQYGAWCAISDKTT